MSISIQPRNEAISALDETVSGIEMVRDGYRQMYRNTIVVAKHIAQEFNDLSWSTRDRLINDDQRRVFSWPSLTVDCDDDIETHQVSYLVSKTPRFRFCSAHFSTPSSSSQKRRVIYRRLPIGKTNQLTSRQAIKTSYIEDQVFIDMIHEYDDRRRAIELTLIEIVKGLKAINTCTMKGQVFPILFEALENE
ncbi:hypothetical protein [uncultured Umboniibacter sp.]|uniref:hypothetical protein n=1 Tax=uncultured Umboniibacter sp. TaxID=1798917 RepID=UPI002628FBE3|nr:hypothetical protein [uncultured Umboniibacter sp.]